VTSVNGTPIIPLEDNGGVLNVDATGTPCIESLRAASGNLTGDFTFSDYGMASLPGIPAGAKPLTQAAVR
jgi:hypothetical protein